MKQSLSLTKFGQQCLAAVSVFISRLDVLPANISPLGSFGFFGNPVLYVLSIVAFDVFVKGVYPGVLLTYLGFAMYPLLGRVAGQNLKKQLILLPTASFLFFVFSNLGVWWYWYDHTLAELIVCFTLAIPFYSRTLVSDVLIGYGYLLIRHWNRVVRTSSALPQHLAVIK